MPIAIWLWSIVPIGGIKTFSYVVIVVVIVVVNVVIDMIVVSVMMVVTIL